MYKFIIECMKFNAKKGIEIKYIIELMNAITSIRISEVL